MLNVQICEVIELNSYFVYELSKLTDVVCHSLIEFLVLDRENSVVPHNSFSLDKAQTLGKVGDFSFYFGNDPVVIKVFHKLCFSFSSF
jgi:hypothetical protein